MVALGKGGVSYERGTPAHEALPLDPGEVRVHIREYGPIKVIHVRAPGLRSIEPMLCRAQGFLALKAPPHTHTRTTKGPLGTVSL